LTSIPRVGLADAIRTTAVSSTTMAPGEGPVVGRCVGRRVGRTVGWRVGGGVGGRVGTGVGRREGGVVGAMGMPVTTTKVGASVTTTTVGTSVGVIGAPVIVLAIVACVGEPVGGRPVGSNVGALLPGTGIVEVTRSNSGARLGASVGTSPIDGK
jgi:hypothetical protein